MLGVGFESLKIQVFASFCLVLVTSAPASMPLLYRHGLLPLWTCKPRFLEVLGGCSWKKTPLSVFYFDLRRSYKKTVKSISNSSTNSPSGVLRIDMFGCIYVISQ